MTDGESYSARLLKFWAPDRVAFVWLLLALPPLLFFQTFIHEGLHYVRAEMAGKDPFLIPFPHFNTRFNADMIGVTLNTDGSPVFPQLVCFVFLLLVIAAFILTSPRWRWLRSFLTWWYLGLCIDLLAATAKGLFGASGSSSDWGKFEAQSSGLALLLSWAILLAILSQLAWIRISRWHKNRPPGKPFRGYRIEAALLMVISAFAAYESYAVEDQSIVRNGRFTFFAVGQIVAAVGYFGYLIWTFATHPKPAVSSARA